MTKLESILKSKDITLPTKILIIKAIVFPVVMSGCESWTTNKTGRWCSRRLLRVPWTAKRSNQSVLKEINSELFTRRSDAEAETPILWPPYVKSWFFGKNPDAGREWGKEEKGITGWDGWMASPTWWTWVWVNSGSWWWTGRPGVLWFMGSQRVRHDWATDREAWCAVVHGVAKSWTWLNDWTELNWGQRKICFLS